MKYLNVGCGKKFSKHEVWENIDMYSHSKHVREYNLLKGFPYPDNKFDTVYHSQVLEHIPKEEAAGFLKECHRVLKEGGIIRVVVPDLENIIGEYQKLLTENLQNPTQSSRANYDWIMLELYDQTVRNESGGLMKKYHEKPTLVNEEYMKTRTGFVGKKIKETQHTKESSSNKLQRVIKEAGLFPTILKIINIIKSKTLNVLLGNKYRVGNFRLSGEIHYWMYDKFSLGELLKSVGFQEIKVKSPNTSDILNWNEYQLDVKDGMVYDPNSLFIEAKKMTT